MSCLLPGGILLSLLWAPGAYAAESGDVFTNDAGCFCLLPRIMPKRWASVSSVAYAVAQGPDGRLYVAGTEPRTPENLGSGWLVKAYDRTGAISWSRTYVWQEQYYNVARSIAIDPMGRVVVAGYAEHSRNGANPTHWLVGVYGQDGEPLWSDSIEHANFVRAEGVAVGPKGGVTVAGWKSRTGFQPYTQWLIRSYTRDGRLRWVDTFGSGETGKDKARAIAAAPAGGMIVAGNIDEGGGRSAWCIRKYNANGSIAWSRTTLHPSSLLDEPYAVAVSPSGHIAVAGKVYGGLKAGTDWSVQLWDQKGNLLWSRVHNGRMSEDDKAHAVTFDPCGYVLVGGYENGDAVRQAPYDAGNWVVRRYDLQGKVLATYRPDQLEVAAGSPFGFALREDRTVTLVGFEATQEAGITRWVRRQLADLACTAASL